jgi:putative transcriptional regulator
MTSKNFKSAINFGSTLRVNDQNGYYEGYFLIATPTMTGEVFAGSVIYVFAHNAGGAMGVMINKPLEMVHYASLFQQLGLETGANNRDLMVYHGGPVEENRGFVVHSSDYVAEDTLQNDCGIYVTASMGVLRDLSKGRGPAHALMTIGYAGWAAGQLEAEIEANYWLTIAARSDIVFFADDNAKYNLAAKTVGVDMMRLSPVAGHA